MNPVTKKNDQATSGVSVVRVTSKNTSRGQGPNELLFKGIHPDASRRNEGAREVARPHERSRRCVLAIGLRGGGGGEKNLGKGGGELNPGQKESPD